MNDFNDRQLFIALAIKFDIRKKLKRTIFKLVLWSHRNKQKRFKKGLANMIVQEYQYKHDNKILKSTLMKLHLNTFPQKNERAIKFYDLNLKSTSFGAWLRYSLDEKTHQMHVLSKAISHINIRTKIIYFRMFKCRIKSLISLNRKFQLHIHTCRFSIFDIALLFRSLKLLRMGLYKWINHSAIFYKFYNDFKFNSKYRRDLVFEKRSFSSWRHFSKIRDRFLFSVEFLKKLQNNAILFWKKKRILNIKKFIGCLKAAVVLKSKSDNFYKLRKMKCGFRELMCYVNTKRSILLTITTANNYARRVALQKTFICWNDFLQFKGISIISSDDKLAHQKYTHFAKCRGFIRVIRNVRKRVFSRIKSSISSRHYQTGWRLRRLSYIINLLREAVQYNQYYALHNHRAKRYFLLRNLSSSLETLKSHIYKRQQSSSLRIMAEFFWENIRKKLFFHKIRYKHSKQAQRQRLMRSIIFWKLYRFICALKKWRRFAGMQCYKRSMVQRCRVQYRRELLKESVRRVLTSVFNDDYNRYCIVQKHIASLVTFVRIWKEKNTKKKKKKDLPSVSYMPASVLLDTNNGGSVFEKPPMFKLRPRTSIPDDIVLPPRLGLQVQTREIFYSTEQENGDV